MLKQWLRSAIQDEAKISQISPDSVRVQGLSRRPSSGLLYPVSPEQEHNRKGRKHKVSVVSSSQAQSKMKTGHRPQQAQHFSRSREIQNGDPKFHQGLSDAR